MNSAFKEIDIQGLASCQLPKSMGIISSSELDGCALFGAGVVARQILAHLQRQGRRPEWIIDNDPNTWGHSLDGIPIRSAESLHEVGDRLVVVASSFLGPMAWACERAHVKRWVWFTDIKDIFGGIEATLGDIAHLKDPEVDRMANLLDSQSRNIFRKALTFRVTGERSDLPPASPDQYFPQDLVSSSWLQHFVDCGAYIGDTLENWNRRIRGMGLSYHGFEPDPDNYCHLERRCRELSAQKGIECHAHPEAVGSRPNIIGMAQGGSGTVLGIQMRDGPKARVVRLDDVLKGCRVTAIKMDLEGFEPEALEGARRLIELQRPLLQIAVYHRPDHLWRIPLWLHDLELGYRLHLRHHSNSFAETIFYAIPEEL